MNHEDRDESKKLITRLLLLMGEDPTREGLRGTPDRVIRSWNKLYSGYNQDPKKILSKAEFSEHGDYDQMVGIYNIDFYSTCEHHILPFFGTASIAYLPEDDSPVVGASKLPRLLECFARRLQIQERMTQQIANILNEVVKPKGCGVIIQAKHFCMIARGVEKQNAIMKTIALRGNFYEQGIKDEFLRLSGI